MKKYWLFLTVLATVAFIGCRALAAERKPNRLTFYKAYDPSIKTLEGYLAKNENPKEMNATIDEVLDSMRRAFERDFVDWEEYKTFLRNGVKAREIAIVPCAFRDQEVDYLTTVPSRRIAQIIRSRYSGEICIRYKDRDRVSLRCGQGLPQPVKKVEAMPPPPPPAPAMMPPEKTSPWLPPKTTLPEAKPVKVVEKKCEWRYESNPSPPISTSFWGGAGYHWGGVMFGSGVSIGASHRQESCQ